MTNYVELSVTYLHETADAVLIEDGDGREVWLPKSQLNDFSEHAYDRGEAIEIEVAEWLAMKRGLI